MVNPDSARDCFERCHFTCVYCGFDGRAFDAWMQLSIDHLRPRSSGGTDERENLVAACGQCNSITCKMKFPPELSLSEILEQKRTYVIQSRRGYYQRWMEEVAPHFLDRPLPGVWNLQVAQPQESIPSVVEDVQGQRQAP
jgi:hypothetical protein